MKKEEVKINVIGRSASGKSCVMFEIYKALKTAGFEVELDLKDNLGIADYETEVDFMKQMLKDERKRVESVKKKYIGKYKLYLIDDIVHVYYITKKHEYPITVYELNRFNKGKLLKTINK